MVRLVGSFLVLSVLMVAAVSVLAYLRARNTLQASVYARLDAAVQQKQGAVDSWVDDQRRNVVFVGQLFGGGESSGDPQLKRLSQQLLSPDTTPAERRRAHDSILQRPQRRREPDGRCGGVPHPRSGRGGAALDDAGRRGQGTGQGEVLRRRGLGRHGGRACRRVVALEGADDHDRDPALRPGRPGDRRACCRPQPGAVGRDRPPGDRARRLGPDVPRRPRPPLHRPAPRDGLLRRRGALPRDRRGPAAAEPGTRCTPTTAAARSSAPTSGCRSPARHSSPR